MKDLTKIKTPFGLLGKKTRKALRAHGGPYRKYVSGGYWAFTADPDWSDKTMIIRLPIVPDHGAIDYKPADLPPSPDTDPHPIFAAVKEWQEAWDENDGPRRVNACNMLAALKVPE